MQIRGYSIRPTKAYGLYLFEISNQVSLTKLLE
jgi:hypothetical protein